MRGSSRGHGSMGSAGPQVRVRAARQVRLLVRGRPRRERRALPLLQQPKQRSAVAPGAQLGRHLADHACAARRAHQRSARRCDQCSATPNLRAADTARNGHAPGCIGGGAPPGAARMMKRVPSSCISVCTCCGGPPVASRDCVSAAKQRARLRGARALHRRRHAHVWRVPRRRRRRILRHAVRRRQPSVARRRAVRPRRPTRRAPQPRRRLRVAVAPAGRAVHVRRRRVHPVRRRRRRRCEATRFPHVSCRNDAGRQRDRGRATHPGWR